MQHYIAKEIVCPFYAQESETVIFHNEGAIPLSRVNLSFMGKKSMLTHRDLYCKSLQRYMVCPVYKMLAAKYGEGDG
jgi:hypothetical protein